MQGNVCPLHCAQPAGKGRKVGMRVQGDTSRGSPCAICCAARRGATARHAIERYRTVTSNLETTPNNVVFQTWRAFPTRFLPESDPETLTFILQTIGTH
jgi:hypothetical protein